MTRLLRDRCFEYAPNRAWDLVTGETVAAHDAEDEPRAISHPSGPLIELLDHGVEGRPRWIVAAPARNDVRSDRQMVAAESRRRGYVPIAIEIFLRARLLLAEHLRTRALVLIARPNSTFEQTQAAMLHAAALSSRPHLLVTWAEPRRGRQPVHWRAAEARAAYSPAPPPRNHALTASADVQRLVEKTKRASDFVHCGRHAAAERLLRETAAALARRRASREAADSYIALGRLLLERGRVAGADEAFGEAAEQAESTDSRRVIVARIWQAAARTDAGQLTSAESLCRAVLLTAPPDDGLRELAEATLARVLFWQGRTAEALPLSFVSQPCAGSAFVTATAIRLLLQSGDHFEAGRRARDLLERTASADALTKVVALAAHLQVFLAAGDLTLAEERMRTFSVATRAVRTPLRLARMRLAWAHALRRAGRTCDADRELRKLARLRPTMPPLLRSALDRTLNSPAPLPDRAAPTRTSAEAADLVTLAQREEDDGEALNRIGDFVRRTMQATRVDFWTADAGPATAVIAVGTGLPTRLGPRALEAGTSIGPERVESGSELAVPIRLGSQLVGALCARWPADRPSPLDAPSFLNLAGAVSAPRVEALNHRGREVARAATAIPELVGASGAVTDVRRAVARAAAAPFSVMIEGESGVGKELVARAIHQLSPRRSRRFCDVNCAALPDDLFESELFGHSRGAFTGAVADRPGLVEEADGGTLFLDEVAELSSRGQAKLLRVLQQQEVRRLGESFTRKVDVRFVSAANRELRQESEQGRFRADLLYRLDVIRIRIPPLRDRPEDVPPLVRHFWAAAAGRVNTRATLSHGVLVALTRYHWPGNVRELQNVMAALAVEAPARGVLRATVLPAVITGATAVTSGRLSAARIQWERRFVEVALARAGGNRTRAARDLGLTRQGLLKILERVGIGAD